MDQVYGDKIDINKKLAYQLNLPRSPEDDINSDKYIIVHPPSIDKVDQRLSSIIPYDGFGKD